MSSLKPKNLEQRDPQPEASLLPDFMKNLGSSSETVIIPLEKLKDAPEEWNFYSPLPKKKLYELSQSIQDNGLFHPIVVWKRDEYYCILSGHNRVRAYKLLFRETRNPEYLSIPASVKEDLDEAGAREIIVDSNWAQRILSTSEKTKSIYQKYVLLGRKKRSKPGEGGYERRYDQIAKSYSLSGKQIQRYIKLNALIPHYLQLIDDGKLSIRAGLILADFDIETQEKIAPLIRSKRDQKAVLSLNKQMTLEAMERILRGTSEQPKYVTLKFDVPIEKKDAFVKMAKRFLEIKNFRAKE